MNADPAAGVEGAKPSFVSTDLFASLAVAAVYAAVLLILLFTTVL